MKYNITFKNYFKKFGIFSIVIFLTSLLLIIFKGLNYGIDFKGGTLIEVQINNNNVEVSNLRSALNELNLGDVNVKNFGKQGNYLIKIEEKIEKNENYIQEIKNSLNKKISEELNYIGVLTVEYFITEKDELLVNELAPRFHNSGHLTIDAFNISQFQKHVLSVMDLGPKPIGKISNAEMYNILGSEILDYRKKTFKKNEFFYDYLKKEPRDGRKMGHITILKD